jgi:tetratricopeptide (TPR) repeat protein
VSEYILEGGIYIELGQLDKAKAAHAKALSIDPENPEAHFLIGKAAFDKGQYDSSLVDFNQAVKYFESRYDRTTKVLFQNLPEVDEELATQIRTLWVENKEAELDELVKVRLGFDGGLNTQRRLIEQFQKTAEGLARTYYYVGMVHYNQRNDSFALKNLNKSLSLNANDIDALYYAGEIGIRDNNYDEAISYFTKITQIKDDDVFAWFYLGVCYAQKKDYPKAVDIYENKVLILDPKNIDAMTNLAYAYREIGNNKKALEWLTKAEKLQKEQ